jgi:succinyl-diaminopimelate desuccinylase
MKLNQEQLLLIKNTTKELESEAVQFLSDFIKIETENPPGNNYLECVKFLGKKMEELGCEVEYVEVPEEGLEKLAPESRGYPRYLVIGKYKGESERPLIHFSGHYDVVPKGGGWTKDPYGGIVEDHKIFGRGASDMKSGVAAQIMALQVLQKAGFKLKGTYVSSGVPDEESGGHTGMGWMVSSGRLNSSNTDYCVITEPLDPDKICLGHRGTVWFTLTFTGIQSHGSMPSEGLNPIEAMKEFLNRVDERIRPQQEVISKYPIEPEQSRKSTLAVTMMHAGSKINTVPDTCSASFDWRLIPEKTTDWAKKEIIDICEELKKEKLILDYRMDIVNEANPTIVPEDQKIVDVFKYTGENLLGKKMGINFSPGYDDQRFVVHQGKLEAAILYGPGRLTQAHKSDEHIDIKDYLDGISVMAASTAELLGFEVE